MRERNGLYEYIAVYVDDLLIAARDPGEIIRELSVTVKRSWTIDLPYRL
jgi:hypothetical protein